MTDTNWTDVEDVLNDLDFPATKEQIVERAERGRNDRVTRALRALPLSTYASMADIRKSVEVEVPADEEHTATDRQREALMQYQEHRVEQPRDG